MQSFGLLRFLKTTHEILSISHAPHTLHLFPSICLIFDFIIIYFFYIFILSIPLFVLHCQSPFYMFNLYFFTSLCFYFTYFYLLTSILVYLRRLFVLSIFFLSPALTLLLFLILSFFLFIPACSTIISRPFSEFLLRCLLDSLSMFRSVCSYCSSYYTFLSFLYLCFLFS